MYLVLFLFGVTFLAGCTQPQVSITSEDVQIELDRDKTVKLQSINPLLGYRTGCEYWRENNGIDMQDQSGDATTICTKDLSCKWKKNNIGSVEISPAEENSFYSCNPTTTNKYPIPLSVYMFKETELEFCCQLTKDSPEVCKKVIVPPLCKIQNCDTSYPTVCIPSPPPDLDCGEIGYRNFEVLPPDPHRFDGDKNGIGCES